MTIYRLYRENGNCAGFWVQHRGWRNLCAQIRSIGGQRSGSLPGEAEHHNSAAVMMDGYDVASGRRAKLSPTPDQPEDKDYRRIADPPWVRQCGR